MKTFFSKEYILYITLKNGSNENILSPIMSILEVNEIKEQNSYKEVVGKCSTQDIDETVKFISEFDSVTKIVYIERSKTDINKEKKEEAEIWVQKRTRPS